MKKLMTLMLGLSLVMGSVAIGFARQDTGKKNSTAKRGNKGKKNDTAKDKTGK
ncbi:MAG TPA: hypothetical protein VML19_10335 [Verrucomicrobiae bacterium]|nr:hypothetical protein [Verrucomicrobiae bacterium]